MRVGRRLQSGIEEVTEPPMHWRTQLASASHLTFRRIGIMPNVLLHVVCVLMLMLRDLGSFSRGWEQGAGGRSGRGCPPYSKHVTHFLDFRDSRFKSPKFKRGGESFSWMREKVVLGMTVKVIKLSEISGLETFLGVTGKRKWRIVFVTLI